MASERRYRFAPAPQQIYVSLVFHQIVGIAPAVLGAASASLACGRCFAAIP
jgi:hypothetical protein